MPLLKTVCRWIDRINLQVGRIVAWATALVVVVVFVDVVLRYAFNISYVFAQELEWHLFAFIFLMGAGATLLKDGHVRVDIFYQRWSPKGQAWVNLLGVILCLIPGCFLIISTSMNFVQASFSIMEGSPDPGGIPFRWVLKACIPAGFLLLLIQGISMGIKSLLILLGDEEYLKKEGAAH
jgi:TRAP-type mannitol/chloroaromatic compound transport system permease small subunit